MIKSIAVAAVAAIMIFMFAACGSGLVGTWKSEDPESNMELQFKSDQKVVFISAKSTMTGKYSVLENKITFEIKSGEDIEKIVSTFEIKKDKLLLTNNMGQTETFIKQ